MPRDLHLLATDILEACEILQRYAKGRSVDDYNTDFMLRDAIERRFMLIGEAIGAIVTRHPEASSQISNSRAIVAFRNYLAHAYWKIRAEEVWTILHDDIPRLEIEMRQLLVLAEHRPSEIEPDDR